MRFRVPVIDALPTASIERQGELWRLRATPGTLHICLEDSGGTYVWIPLIGYTDAEIDTLLAGKVDQTTYDAFESDVVSGFANNTIAHGGFNTRLAALEDEFVSGVMTSTAATTDETFTAIPALSLAIGVDEIWHIEYRLRVTNPTEIGIQTPTGATHSGTVLFTDDDVAEAPVKSIPVPVSGSTYPVNDSDNSLGSAMVTISVTVQNGATAGNVEIGIASVDGIVEAQVASLGTMRAWLMS